MIQLMKRLLEFSGKQRKNLIASFVFNLLDSVFEMMPIMAILTVLSGLLSVAEGGVMPGFHHLGIPCHYGGKHCRTDLF